MSMTSNIKLTFNGENYDILVEYKRFRQLLNEFPDSIGVKISNQQFYIVESNVKEETFNSFKDYLSDSVEPKLNSDNIYEFYLLSQEFSILTDYLSKKVDEDLLNLSILSSNTEKDKSQSERYISKHLSRIIEKHEQELLRIPISSLFNIFYHPERKLNDHQKAYDFIMKGSSNNSLYALLKTLDGDKLNHKSKFESISKIIERQGFIPKFSQTFFYSLEEMSKHYETIVNEQIPELEETNQLLKKKLNKIKKELSYFKEEYHQIKERALQLTNENEQLKERANQLTKENRKLKERTSQLTNENQQLKERTNQLTKENRQLKERTSQLTNENQQLKERTNQVTKENRQLKERTSQLTNENQQFKERTNQVTKENRQLKERTNQIAKENQQLKERTNQLTKENQQFNELVHQVKEENLKLKKQIKSDENNKEAIINDLISYIGIIIKSEEGIRHKFKRQSYIGHVKIIKQKLLTMLFLEIWLMLIHPGFRIIF